MRITRVNAPGWRAVWVACLVGVASLTGTGAAHAQFDDSPAWQVKPKPKSPASAPPKPKPGAPADTQKPKPPETEADRIKREARELFDPGARSASEEAEGQARGWAIVLGVFRGEEKDTASAVMLRRVREEGGLPRAYLLRRNESVVVALGDYPSPEDGAAVADLKSIQEREFGGLRPYAKAFLSPPMAGGGEMPGKMPQYNLLRAREEFGDKAIYTLQVGAYGRRDLRSPSETDLSECRRAAEQAAYRLRQEGEMAFYYHATTMSMVTVGVFDLSDFDPQIPGYKSEALKGAQKRFPYNLYNGAGIKEKRKGPGGRVTEQMQASNLVALPTH